MGLADSPLSTDLRPNLANLSKLCCVWAKRKNTSIPYMEGGPLGIRTPLLLLENPVVSSCRSSSNLQWEFTVGTRAFQRPSS